MLWPIALVLAALWLTVYHWKRRRLYGASDRIPGPITVRSLPIVGIAHLMGSDNEKNMDLCRKLARESIERKTPIKLWLGQQCFLHLADAEDAEFVLKHCLNKDDFTSFFFRDVVGNGLIYSPLPLWRPRRRIMTTAFTKHALNHYVAVFSRQSKSLVKHLETVCDDGDFSAWGYISRYTMSSICETNLGVDIGQSPDEHPFLKAINKITELGTSRMVQLWLHPDFLYRLTPYYKEMEKRKEITYQFIDDIIRQKKIEYEEKDYQQDQNQESYKTSLEIMIENSKDTSLTDLELRDEALVIAVAGSDTSAVAACFTLALLARHPQVQEKAYEEIFNVFGDSDRPITKEDLSQLMYLEAVIRESIRLYPPVPISARNTDVDIVLPSGIKLVPELNTIVNFWAILRNPRYWGADADHFRPERYLEVMEHRAANMVFSSGPRNCIGNQYAMISLKTVISQILRSYSVLPPLRSSPPPPSPWRENESHFRLKFNIMLRDVDNFMIRIKRRS